MKTVHILYLHRNQKSTIVSVKTFFFNSLCCAGIKIISQNLSNSPNNFILYSIFFYLVCEYELTMLEAHLLLGSSRCWSVYLACW